MDSRDWRLLDTTGATPQQKVDILKYASEIRKFEIERFWGRSVFFWGFIASAFVAYAYIYKADAKDSSDGFVQFVIACFGLVCSVAWTLQNRGGKYWQEAWEQKVESVEREVLGAKLFSNREPIMNKGFWGAANFSVSKLAIMLSDFAVLVWIILAGRVVHIPDLSAADWWMGGVLLVTLISVFCLFLFGRSRD